MGFDLTGLNPKNSTPKPKWSKGEPLIKTGEDSYAIDPHIKEEYDDYIKTRMDWQDSTEGAYFRNNVWWWRPLWHFVCHSCDNILTDKDAEQGVFNDGHKISKTKAKRIASRLRRLLKSGEVGAYKSMYDRHLSKLPNDSWGTSYPFDVENVERFERFCENSGGFQIY